MPRLFGRSSISKKADAVESGNIDLDDPPAVHHAHFAPPDAETLETKLARAKKSAAIYKSKLKDETKAKRRHTDAIVKLARELSECKSELEERSASPAAPLPGDPRFTWYGRGLWRTPALRPELLRDRPSALASRPAVGLAEMYLDVAVVVALSSVGSSLQDRGFCADWSSLAYFAVFWMMWGKAVSYSSKFDDTDVSSQIGCLVCVCIILFGSLYTDGGFDSDDSKFVMSAAAAYALVFMVLYLRIALVSFRHRAGETQKVFRYASYMLGCLIVEASFWIFGIFYDFADSSKRGLVFLGGLLACLRVPRSFLPLNFQALTAQYGVLLVLSLGFVLQSILQTAGPFFRGRAFPDQPIGNYSFLLAVCFLLYCVKLLYVDDLHTIDPLDHALLVNRGVAACYVAGQFLLLASITALGSGLKLLTHNCLSAEATLANNAKTLIFSGFACVVLSNVFLKSLHVRRIPVDPRNRRPVLAAHVLDILMNLLVGVTAGMLCSEYAAETTAGLSDDDIIYSLAGVTFVLVIFSWMDKYVEVLLVEDDSSHRCHRLLFCFKIDREEIEFVKNEVLPLMDSESVEYKAMKKNISFTEGN